MKDYKVAVNKDKKENSVHLVLQGHLGLGQMTDIKADILKAIKDVSSASIEIKDVEESDLSLFQLINSVEKFCMKQNKGFKVEYNLPSEQKKLFLKSGIHV